MQRPATWKVLTLGAAITSLGVLGAGTAMADDTATLPDVINEVTTTAGDDGQASESDRRWWYTFPPNRDGGASLSEARAWIFLPR